MSPSLVESICKVVGHEWQFPRCARCSHRQVLRVSVDGILLSEGRDYTVTNDRVVLRRHEGTVAQIIIGMSNQPWGILEASLSDGYSINV